MRKMTLLTACALTAAVAFGAPPSGSAAEKKEAATKADNSKMNKGENKELTADQQKETKSDREITRNIRRAVVKDKSLSLYAHNVKIITRNGKVTLKGPVRSQKEIEAVENAAAKVAGKENITNELKIAPSKKSKTKE